MYRQSFSWSSVNLMGRSSRCMLIQFGPWMTRIWTVHQTIVSIPIAPPNGLNESLQTGNPSRPCINRNEKAKTKHQRMISRSLNTPESKNQTLLICIQSDAGSWRKKLSTMVDYDFPFSFYLSFLTPEFACSLSHSFQKYVTYVVSRREGRSPTIL